MFPGTPAMTQAAQQNLESKLEKLGGSAQLSTHSLGRSNVYIVGLPLNYPTDNSATAQMYCARLAAHAKKGLFHFSMPRGGVDYLATSTPWGQ